MPKGTVIEHKNGSVKLRVPFDAAATDYKFYTNEVGSGDPNTMVERVSIAAPIESPAGFHEFDITDQVLALRPDRGWHVRITKVLPAGEISRFGDLPTLIREADELKKVLAATTGAIMDGTAGKGLFFFGNRERIKILRVSGSFSVATNYTLEVVKGAAKSLIDSGTAATTISIKDITIEAGEHLELKTVTVGNQAVEAIRE